MSELLNFEDVIKEIPEPTEFANAINSAENINDLIRNISNTKIFQESGAPMYDTISMLALLTGMLPYEPRAIGKSPYIDSSEEFDHADNKTFGGEGMIENEMLTFDIENEEIKGKMENLITNLVNQTELFVRDPRMSDIFGLNPVLQNKLKKIFYE